ncbi:MAG: single-stranded DNA-binding protein [Chlorobiaceae bacterium]
MAKGLNKVMLIGNLGNDPELKVISSGQSRCTFTVATSESFKDSNGNVQDRVEWHRIVVWGKLAEICNQYLKKGRQVYIEGRLQTRSWDDIKSGEKKYATEIVCTDMQMLGGPREQSSGQGYGESAIQNYELQQPKQPQKEFYKHDTDYNNNIGTSASPSGAMLESEKDDLPF